eukprot:SAG31_NODE_525_length_14489_cov_3.693815_12_plen_266_part_00
MPSIDVVADCSDNLATRYLLSDAAVLCGKPLVSGASVGLEGYATIYNHRTASGKQGPCYRCVYPNPPPSASVGSCAENGVIGAVPGVIGCLQALEVLKLTAGLQVTAECAFASMMLTHQLHVPASETCEDSVYASATTIAETLTLMICREAQRWQVDWRYLTPRPASSAASSCGRAAKLVKFVDPTRLSLLSTTRSVGVQGMGFQHMKVVFDQVCRFCRVLLVSAVPNLQQWQELGHLIYCWTCGPLSSLKFPGWNRPSTFLLKF